ncbi:MAG TPA: hypothetical protein PKV16_01290 [Caldisericia bacterium]|nr:hypothetical protein [Caldisericia bacterium]HPF48954.1 hypothetical protein [Caldisericia bacterium]HPI83182.1 hypothetical protein [Caldisericia bacterium]HPQ92409.1 hypothetical protein [Caldisericia bacterium]HRV74493.1 hypothetical protein [Caldisericia bacterium]
MPLIWGFVFFLFLLGFPYLLVIVSNKQNGWLKIAGWILAGAFTLMLIVSSLFMLAFTSHRFGGCNVQGFRTVNCRCDRDCAFFNRNTPQTRFGDIDRFEIPGENKTLFFKGNGRDDAFIDGRLLPLSVILKSIDAPEDFTWVKEQLQKMPKEDLMRVADFLSSIEPIPQEKGKPAPQQ